MMGPEDEEATKEQALLEYPVERSYKEQVAKELAELREQADQEQDE